MESDTFLNGRQPGELRSREQIMLLISYLLQHTPSPFNREQLFTVILDDGLANYFNTAEALDELQQNGMITSVQVQGEDCLCLTQQGSASIAVLEQELPLTVREQARKSALQVQTLTRREKESGITIARRPDGYDLTFRLEAQGDTLLCLTVFVADRVQAQTIRKKFLQDPAQVYKDIIDLLTV